MYIYLKRAYIGVNNDYKIKCNHVNGSFFMFSVKYQHFATKNVLTLSSGNIYYECLKQTSSLEVFRDYKSCFEHVADSVGPQTVMVAEMIPMKFL
jgi:hypothetical protein